MTSANHQFQRIARGVPSPRLSIGGRRCPLPASAATQSTIDNREYRSTDTALGRRLGMCRSTRALRTTGRGFGRGLGCFIDVVPPDDLSRGEVLGSLFGNLRTKPRWQGVAVSEALGSASTMSAIVEGNALLSRLPRPQPNPDGND